MEEILTDHALLRTEGYHVLHFLIHTLPGKEGNGQGNWVPL